MDGIKIYRTVEVKDGRVTNLEYLMRGVEWQDSPSEESFCCLSWRGSRVFYDEKICILSESHQCRGTVNIYIKHWTSMKSNYNYTYPQLLLKNMDVETLYVRYPHSRETYVRETFTNDLRSKPEIWRS